MITCVCVDCNNSEKFSSQGSANDAGFFIIGILINDNEYKGVCRKCDYTGVYGKMLGKRKTTEPNKIKKEEKPLKNGAILSFE